MRRSRASNMSAASTSTLATLAFGSLIPVDITPTIPPNFSPPSTCFPTTISATYTADRSYSLYQGRLLLEPLATQCYPPAVESLGMTDTSHTITANSTLTTTIIAQTAPFYAATTCPPGFLSRTASDSGSTRTVHCCPPGYPSLTPVFEGFSGCILVPTTPVTVISSGITTTLAAPSGELHGISYLAVPIAFAIDESNSTTNDTTTQSSGLSTGAKAGIGVGVSLGVILVALLGAGAWYLRRRRARARSAAEPQAAEVSGEGRALYEVTGRGDERIHEMRHVELSEKDGKEEMYAPVELEGDYRGVEAPTQEKAVEMPGSKVP